jgi:hypothetical protein
MVDKNNSTVLYDRPVAYLARDQNGPNQFNLAPKAATLCRLSMDGVY